MANTIPTSAEIHAASNSAIHHDMCQWGMKIASDNRYHYVRWKPNISATHTCPVCKGRKSNNYFGWNCIGFSFACWHHGGGISSKCSCHVIDDSTGTKMLASNSKAEMLKTARSHIGVNDLEIIYNSGKHIPHTMLKPGDILMQYSGSTYKHTLMYIGNNKKVHSTSAGTDANQISTSAYPKSGCKVGIRYTGGRGYLSYAASGEAVKKIQAIIGVTADGEFGPKTEAAVKAWQKKNGLVSDGLVGPKTLAKMAAAIKPATQPTPAPAPVQKKGYSGTIPSLALKKSNAEVIADTIRWAKWIACDNRFHYGKGSGAHHNGCYFCGTQDRLKKNKGVLDHQFSYCCNPFAGAAWAHGGCDQTAIKLCRKNNSWDFHEGTGYDKSPKFKKLGHPAKSALKAGDVLCRGTHVAIYIGGGKIAHAGHEDDNKRNSASWNSSISVQTLTDKNYANFPRVYRYLGSVDVTNFAIRFGEVSYRVKDLQKYLNWYFGKEVLIVDGLFGDGTLKYVKAFQTATKIAADGIVGPNTVKKMEAAVK